MWGASTFVPLLDVSLTLRVVSATTIAVVGLCFDIAGIISFSRARTTINPMKPSKSSSLVSTGVYRLTRNPMYLGVVFILIGWAVFLSSVWLLLGPLAFVLYMNRFQITPEESVLSDMFGSRYSEYRSQVRRWL